MKILSCIFALLTVGLFAADNISAQTDRPQVVPAAALKTDNQPLTAPRGYVLAPGDDVEVRVMTEETFGGKYTVDEDGKLLLAFTDKPIQAACRTEREVKEDIAAALGKYLKKPQFSMQVTKHSPPAVVYGEVRNPAKVEMMRRARLQEILAFSGGPTEKAGGTVAVWHTLPNQCPEPGEQIEAQSGADVPANQLQIFKLSDIVSGKADSNPYVRPGDVIDVQKAPPVYVIGEVRALPTDGVSIQEGGLTLTEVIARAGGLNRDAKKKDVRIYRLKPGAKNGTDVKNRDVISKNLDLIKKGQQQDEILQPYDIVEVEKAPKSITQTMLEIATGTIKNTANIIPQTIVYR